MSTDSKHNFPHLNASNWGQWSDNMEAHLQTKELWEYVDGSTPRPTFANPTQPTASEQKELNDWKRKAGKASGEIWLSLEDNQKVHIKDVKSDPAAMWSKLESVHLQKRPGTCFNAYDALFSIRKANDETLPALMARAEKAMQDIKVLRPSNFTLEMLDKELQCMLLIRALPADYNTFASSILLLDAFDLDKLQSAFHNEESQRLARNVAPSSSLALQSFDLLCFFCGGKHLEKDCYRKKKASEEAKKQIAQTKEKGRKKGKQKAQESSETSAPEEGNAAQIEFAGHASALLSSSSRSQWLKSRACTDWNTDTGATSHMTPHKHWFRSYSPHVVPIRLANNSIIYSAGIGSVEFQPVIGGIPKCPVVFHDVLHVPQLGSNLLSLFHLTRLKGYEIGVKNDCVHFTHSGELHFTATITQNNVGYLDGHAIVPQQAQTAETALYTSTCPLDLTLWHRRCSHLNFADLKHMHLHNKVKGMVIKSKTPPDPICDSCIMGKQRRHNIPKTATRRHSTLALIHTDLKGPLPVVSMQGHSYWQAFVDDASWFWVVAFLSRKSEALTAFKRYKAYAEKALGKSIMVSRDDKGGEFISKEYFDYTADEGIRRQHTEPGEPHQNGVAERSNEDIAAGATALLVQAKLPPSFWELAVATYVHTRNRMPTSALNGETPYFYWKKKKPDISYFRVFGCLAYVLIPKHKRKALQPHSKKCIFVGYPDGTKAWRFWDPVDRKIIISSHAVFDERCFPGNSTTSINLLSPTPPPPEVVLHQGGDDSDDDEAPEPEQLPAPAPNDPVAEIPEANQPDAPPDAPAPLPPPPNEPPARRQNPIRSGRPKGSLNENALRKQTTLVSPDPNQMRSTTPPLSPVSESDDELLLKDGDGNDSDELEYADTITAGLAHLLDDEMSDYLTFDQALMYAGADAFKTSTHDGEPGSFHEAMERPSPERDHWYKAALDEIQSLLENGTFELVQLPPGRKAVGSKWVFKVKRKADGSVERYKGRLVAQGFSQRPGFDYTETFAPTPQWAAIRATLALAALEDLYLESVDISSAFLNGKLEEEVYMRQPEGFVEKDKTWVWRLIKSIYGLKQAGRCWHKKLNEELESMGFKRVVCSHSIWIFKRGDSRIIIPVFIDDMTIAAKSAADVQSVKDDLKKCFKLRDLGPTSWLLGVEITRNRAERSLSLSQRQYIISLLERFNLSDCNPVSTPMDPGIKLSASMSPSTPEDIDAMRSIPYLQAVGALMYLAVATRPDISYSVGVLARFNKNPGLQHWKAVKHLLRYLKGTLDLKLTYAPTPSSDSLFTTYSDADLGGNPDNGRSTGGYVVKMGTGAISWSSRLQSIVALSTTEAEFVASTSAGQEILWLRNLFHELGYTVPSASPLFIDNHSALSVAKNPEHHGRMKHLDLRFYWLRDEVEKGTISVAHVCTDLMPADIMTKALGRVKVLEMVGMLGLQK